MCFIAKRHSEFMNIHIRLSFCFTLIIGREENPGGELSFA